MGKLFWTGAALFAACGAWAEVPVWPEFPAEMVIDDQGNDLPRYTTRLDANGMDLWLDVAPKGIVVIVR